MRLDEAVDVLVGTVPAVAVYLGDVLVWEPDAGEPPAGFEIVGYARAPIAAVNDVALTFTNEPDGVGGAYVPVEGDVVNFAFTSTSAVTWTCPATWVNPLGGNTTNMPSDGTLVQGMAAHAVTGAEATGGSATFTWADCFSTSETGEAIGWIVRGADIVTVYDAAAPGNNATTTTAQTLPGLEGDDLATGSMVFAAIFSDALATYTTPTGWSPVQASSNTNQGGAVYVLDTLTVAGADLAPTSITSSASDEHAATTAAILAAA